MVEGDITEKESMRDAMAGVDGVFHLAAWSYIGPGRGNEEMVEQTHVWGTRNVLELMDELRIPKGVYTSTIGVYPIRDWEHIDESVEPECPDSVVYMRTKWKAQYEVAKPMIDAGLPLVIVQLGNVYGPGDKSSGSARAVFLSYLQGDLPMISRGHYVPWDYVVDIARAHVLAMDRGEPGETYIISGEPQQMVDLFECAADITRIPAPRLVSPKVIRGLAKIMGVVERVVTPSEGLEAELFRTAAAGGWPVDNTKATTELGISHRPLEEGLREYLDWEMDQLGMRGDAESEIQEAARP